MAKEELLYSLKLETLDAGQILFGSGDTIQKLYFICAGEISIVLQLDNGEEIITDMLSTGSNLGAYSILKDAKQMFTIKANKYTTLMYLDRDALIHCRDEFKEINNELIKCESYIEEEGIPV